MPKIIIDLKETIIQKSRPLFFENYEGLTMRAIAKECSVAVGTIYNYFPSKEVLLAHIILEDWLIRYAAMKEKVDNAPNALEGIWHIYEGVLAFSNQFRPVWNNVKNASVPSVSFRSRHAQLVEQLSALIEGLITRFHTFSTQGLDSFIAESILTYTNGNQPFYTLQPILQKLLQNI